MLIAWYKLVNVRVELKISAAFRAKQFLLTLVKVKATLPQWELVTLLVFLLITKCKSRGICL